MFRLIAGTILLTFVTLAIDEALENRRKARKEAQNEEWKQFLKDHDLYEIFYPSES